MVPNGDSPNTAVTHAMQSGVDDQRPVLRKSLEMGAPHEQNEKKTTQTLNQEGGGQSIKEGRRLA